MQRTNFHRIVWSLLLACFAATTCASQADELRDRAAAMRKEAAVLAERGNKEEAERLEQGALKLLEAAERQERKVRDGQPAEKHPEKHPQKHPLKDPGIDQEASHLKARLQDLLAQERKLQAAAASEKELAKVREQIAGAERELHALHEHHLHSRGPSSGVPKELYPQMEKIQAATRRIQHLRVAAENLMQAEVPELAQQIMEEAKKLEQEVQKARQQIEAEIHKSHVAAPGPENVQDLRAEIERLRAEVLELRERAKK
jgi:hypothetical protein